jgi:TetR/AcrR family transcriptional repressor of nem operon
MLDTKTAIIDAATSLTQLVGYNALSFRDLAERVGIRSASVHHHFPTKADLCVAMIERHRDAMRAAIASMNRTSKSSYAKLNNYSRLFQKTINDGNRMCLCGMLSADLDSLTPTARAALQGAFNDHESWLSQTLDEGRAAGELHFVGTPLSAARALIAGLEGALLVARTYGDPKRFSATARDLIDLFRLSRASQTL